jgi:diacylglycerol kinase family enzyme
MATIIGEMGAGTDDGTDLRFTTPWGGHAERTPMTIVSNNPYVFSGPPDYGRRKRLDGGMLGISAAGHGTSADGREGSGVRHWEAERLVLESDAPILAGLDGEAIVFGTTLEVVIRPRGLRVLVPAGTKPGYVPPRESIKAGLIGLARLAGVPGIVTDDE